MLVVVLAQAQVPSWQLAMPIGAPVAVGSASRVKAIATGTDGSLYLAGEFSNSINVGGTIITSVGLTDMFVAKWNPSTATFAWVRQAGGSANDLAVSLAAVEGGIVVAGNFASSSIAFGGTTLAGNPTANSLDVFVTKLNDAGSFVWAKQLGGTGSHTASALAANGGSLYLTGNFFDATLTIGATTLTNAGPTTTSDIYVAKLLDGGASANWTWAYGAGGPSNDNSNALALSGSNVYFTGHFAQNATFGSLSLTCSTIADLYVAKLLDAGASASFTWVQQASGPGYNETNALVANGTSVYVGGTMMQANSTLPSLVFGATTLVANAVSEIFVAKLTDAGSNASWVWACKSNNPSNGGLADLHGLLLSGTAVYVTGLCAGAGPCFGTNPFSAYGGNIFVSRLTDQGNTVAFDWALRGGNSYVEAGNALALRAGLVYMVGYAAKSPILFGAIALTTTPSSDSQRGILAAISDSGVLATAPALTNQFTMAVFPNPAHGKVQVASRAVERVLYNAQGAIVRTFATGLTTLDLSGIAPGIYYLQTGQQGTRLVVE